MGLKGRWVGWICIERKELGEQESTATCLESHKWLDAYGDVGWSSSCSIEVCYAFSR